MRFLVSTILWITIAACALGGMAHSAPLASHGDAQYKAAKADPDLNKFRYSANSDVLVDSAATTNDRCDQCSVAAAEHHNHILYTKHHQAQVRAPPVSRF